MRSVRSAWMALTPSSVVSQALRYGPVSQLRKAETVWSRIARTQVPRPRRSQKNSARLSSTILLARRTITGPVQRRLGFDDLCTAFFSTAVFTSAVIETNRKAACQKDWAEKIKDARKDLNALKADQERRISNLANTIDLASASSNEVVSNQHPQIWQEVFTWAEGEMRERKALGYEHWQGMPLDVLRETSPDKIQEFQLYYRHCFAKVRSSPGTDVWSSATWALHLKKLRTLEWSIARMMHKMMSHILDYHHSSLHSLDVPDTMKDVLSSLFSSSSVEHRSKLDYIQSQLITLRYPELNDDYYLQFESPKYPRYTLNQVHFPSGTDELNAKLHSVFQSTPQGTSRIETVIPKICYHLLSSEAPPNIHTYNLLLLEFASKHQKKLIGYILESIHGTHMRPNEITLAETLRHYTRTDQRTEFEYYVDCMDGFGEGLQVSDPRLNIPDLLKHRHRVRVIRKGDNGDTIQDYHDFSKLSEADISAIKPEDIVKVYEKPRRNLDVYQALIQGALSFDEVHQAMEHYRTMISEGWEPNKDILMSILQRCLSDGDWDAGIATWTCLWRHHALDDERVYILMLHLCRKMNKHEYVHELLQEGIHTGILPPAALEMGWHEPSILIETQSFEKALSVAKDIGTLEQGLQSLLQDKRAMDEDTRKTFERVRFFTDVIKTAVPFPSHTTIALLRQARALISTRVNDLEARVEKEAATILQLVEDMKKTIFSMCSQGLEHCFGKISASITHLNADFKLQTSHIKSKRYRAQYDAFDTKPGVIREEAFAYVNTLLRPLVLDLKMKIDRLQNRILITSDEIKNVMTQVYGATVTFKSIDEVGTRWTYAIKVGIQGCAQSDESLSLRGSDTKTVKAETQAPTESTKAIRKVTQRRLIIRKIGKPNFRRVTGKSVTQKVVVDDFSSIRSKSGVTKHLKDSAWLYPRYRNDWTSKDEGAMNATNKDVLRSPDGSAATRSNRINAPTYLPRVVRSLSLNINHGDYEFRPTYDMGHG
ncbi:MAG: hypothetical protein Q9170_007171 [Blastenia crenularia]